MLYIGLIITIVCIILIDLYFKKRKKDIFEISLKKSFTDNFERNILLVLIFSSGAFFYLANNYKSIKEYSVKFFFSKNIENAGPETLREIYDDAMSKDSSLLIEKLIEENPENSELHALAAYYFRGQEIKIRESSGYSDNVLNPIHKKQIYHATQAISIGSYYEPWLLQMRGRAKYILKDYDAKKDYIKSASLFEILLEASPGDANLLYELADSKLEKNGVYFREYTSTCGAISPEFLIPMQYFKQALNNSSKDDPHVNMFGWELGNLHFKIYDGLESNARLNIGVYTTSNYNYDNFKASRHWSNTSCEEPRRNNRVYLDDLMFSNGFCEIFSNAGEQGYEEAYDVIQKWCN